MLRISGKVVVLVLYLLFNYGSFASWAQLPTIGEADFTIYAVDSRGSRDSVRIVITDGSTCRAAPIDLALGEHLSNDPFSASVLDLRVRRTGLLSDTNFYKTIILPPRDPFDPMTQDGCGIEFLPLNVSTPFTPVTFSWDKEYFRSVPWLQASYMTNDASRFISYPYYGFTPELAAQFGTSWSFLVDDDSIAFNTDTVKIEQSATSAVVDFDDGNTGEVYGVLLKLGSGLDLAGEPCCPEYRIVATQDYAYSEATLSVLVNGDVHCEGLAAGPHTVMWLNTVGQVVEEGQFAVHGVARQKIIPKPSGDRGLLVLRIRHVDTGKFSSVASVSSR